MKERLFAIRDQWVEVRLGQLIKRGLTQDEKNLIFSEEIFDYFLKDIQFFLNHCEIADYPNLKKWDRLIFEGAQGLLLDQGSQYFPHVTRSNTGLQNVSTIAG